MKIKNQKIRPIVSIVLLIMVAFLFQPGSVGGASVVRTDKNTYDQGEGIKVYFSNAPGNDRDWICIVPAGSPDNVPGDYKYMPRGLGRGSLFFDPRSPGKYEVRAYYNYRSRGYVVSGRHPFSVGSYSVKEVAPREEAFVQPMEPIEPNIFIEANLPPPIPFVGPPNVVVLPGTDVYAVPDVSEELFFRQGWWWRQWRGNWYRSRYHDHGWAHYHDYPSWHRNVPHDWRHNYSNHIWGGRPWNPPHINHGRLNNHWRGGHWRTNHGWGHPGGRTGGHGGGLKGGGKGGRTHPDGRMDRSAGGSSHRGDRR